MASSSLVYSMTAFVRQELQHPWGMISWEIRSLNHRYLEIYTHLPDTLKILEGPLRERIGILFKRGKIDCTLYYQPQDEHASALNLNRTLAQQLIDAEYSLRQMLNAPTPAAPLNMLEILRWPGVLQAGEYNLEAVREAALLLLDQSLRNLLEVRAKEGEHLKAVIESRLHSMEHWVEKAKSRVPTVLQQLRQRMDERLQSLAHAMDPHRVEQEFVLLVQRLDVDEELERLRVHLAEAQLILQRSEPIGRRLDFLLQELNREANTLASKSVDVEMTQAAVELKVLIEQIREQVQNIE